MDTASELIQRFRERFGSNARVFRAPGRVNLIGEHTDYNEGFVMPVAIQFSCWVAAAPRADRRLVIYSENIKESVEVDLDNAQPSGRWSDYALGAGIIPDRNGRRLRGANLLISSDVPIGSGLSSSAAIEVSVALAMLSLAEHEIDRKQLALWCQRAENEFAGMRCGIMDQFISCYGEQNRALKLDCRSLEYQLLPLPPELDILVCNTMVKHELAAGEYNIRRRQCEEASRKLSTVISGVKALRDVRLQQLEQHRDLLRPDVYRRCRHVVSENERVERAADALAGGNSSLFGSLMNESHQSLRDDFEVSCPELNDMVEIARRQKGVLGARMTGGGFGGCTVNVVEKGYTAAFRDNVASDYKQATGIAPEIYVCAASKGAEEVAFTGDAGRSR